MLQAELKKAAEEIADGEGSGQSRSIGDWVVLLFDYPPLSFLQGPLEPILETIRDNSIVASAFALGLASIPILVLSSLLSSKVRQKESMILVQYAVIPTPILCQKLAFLEDRLTQHEHQKASSKVPVALTI